MVDENPYAPPDAEVDVAETGELAGRGARLGGIVRRLVSTPSRIRSGSVS